MDSLAAGQLGSLLESLRLLETLVAGPPSLRSEIRAARRALPIPDAGQTARPVIPASEPESIPGTAAKAIRQTALTLDLIEDLNGGSLPGWATHARSVLARAEMEVCSRLRAETAARVRGLYVIVDPEATRGRPVLEIAEAVLEGGASLVQLRDKTGEMGSVLPTARAIRALCESRGALFIVNDDPALAFASGAHGLHGPGRHARSRGQAHHGSRHDHRPLKQHHRGGRGVPGRRRGLPRSRRGLPHVDHGQGSQRPVVGTELITTAKQAAEQPIVAIGGINRHNAAEVVRAGADCICAVGAVTLADDPKTAAEELVDIIDNT